MAIQAPPAGWQKIPYGKDERIWAYLILAMILMMGIFTTTWVFIGDQNPPEEYHKFEGQDFFATAETENSVANGVNVTTLSNGEPALSRSTAGDIYLVAQTFEWIATNGVNKTHGIQLKQGLAYRIHVGSIDLLHGFEILSNSYPIAIQIVPGYDYVIDLIPTTTGLFRIICNEYCGTGHHEMASFMEVVA